MDLKKVDSLAKIPTPILEKYIRENIRRRSEKTGKQVLINTYHQPKSYLVEVIENVGCGDECLKWFKNHQTFKNIEKLTILLAAQLDDVVIDDEMGVETPTLPYNKSKHTISLFPSFKFEDCFFILIDNQYFLNDEHNIVKSVVNGDELVLTDVVEWD